MGLLVVGIKISMCQPHTIPITTVIYEFVSYTYMQHDIKRKIIQVISHLYIHVYALSSVGVN